MDETLGVIIAWIWDIGSCHEVATCQGTMAKKMRKRGRRRGPIFLSLHFSGYLNRNLVQASMD